MNTDAKQIISLISMAVALTLTSGSAVAVDYSGKVRAGIGVSDNISRSAGQEIDETMATAGFEFGATAQSRTVDFNLGASFDYLDYLDDTFDQEWVGGMNGSATFTLVEERLKWIVQDNYGQQLRNPFLSATPNNREDVNYFTTGPTLSYMIGGRDSIIVDARYDRVDYEERPSDNDRLSGTLSFQHALARNRTLSFNVSARRIEYDEAMLAPPWEAYSGYLQFSMEGGQNTISIDAGVNEVEYQGIEADGLLLGINWTRKTSANGSLTVSGGSRYSDQGDLFRDFQNNSFNPGDTSDVSNTAAPFLNNYVRFGYSLQHDRFSVATSVNFDQEDFKDSSGLDRDVFSGDLLLRREMTRNVFGGARVRFQHREYKYQASRDDDLTLGLDVGYKIGAGMDVSLEYEHLQRNSTIVGGDFTENRAFLRVSYTPLWSRKTTR